MSEPRSIETKGYAKLTLPATFGKVPKLEWLSIASLVVDPEYQREISSLGRKNIRHIAEHFSWSMFGTVMVAAIGGSRFAIVDGQHRTTAAALCGIERVPCQIVDAPRGEQAAAFRAINGNTTRPHTIQLFHAAVTAGEPKALRVVEVCGRAGIRIVRSLCALRDRETFSVGTIGKGIERHGEATVEIALRMIVHSGDGRAEELNRSIINAVVEVLAAHPDWQRNERVLKLAFEDMNLEEMWRESTSRAARVKGTSSMDILQRDLAKIITRKMQAAA
jgi:5-carboxymethyl-2-hydroxymuconate isomerase